MAGVNAAIAQKLLEVRYVDYQTTLGNVSDQDRTIFQVLFYQSLSKQSQALIKNSVEWGGLERNQCEWNLLLDLVIEVHTSKRGGKIAESAIHMRI